MSAFGSLAGSAREHASALQRALDIASGYIFDARDKKNSVETQKTAAAMALFHLGQAAANAAYPTGKVLQYRFDGAATWTGEELRYGSKTVAWPDLTREINIVLEEMTYFLAGRGFSR